MALAGVTVLGSTGSIGVNTLDVIRRHPDRYRVIGLTAATKFQDLLAQCIEFQPESVAMVDQSAAKLLRDGLDAAGLGRISVLSGPKGLVEVAAAKAHINPHNITRYKVMAAIVGAAGLAPTMAAAHAGKQILLANKEAIVMAGGIFLSTCKASGAEILPIDSEHNAVFQCLPPEVALRHAAQSDICDRFGINSIVLTASGGPFRRFTLEQMQSVTPDQACAHPKWSMGRKISVDSATMMNKGLELIEAHHLFNVPSERLQVVFHPQSVIHSLVTYCDGSVLAQLGNPDMRTPIAHAMAYPDRINSGVAPLNLIEIAKLEFEAPDEVRFPCLRLARVALEAGGNAPCVLNAANEIAVEAFLSKKIGFCDIAQVNESVTAKLSTAAALPDLEAVLEADFMARRLALETVVKISRIEK
jgi:1-deoxy-D-xylulose-5-phosphate reductoisomerase